METSQQQIQEFESVLSELKEMLHLPDEVMIRLYNKFFESILPTLTQLNEAAVACDFESIEMLAHAIKGSAGSLRYTAMREIAQELEKNAHLKEKDAYQERFNELLEEFNRAEECFKLWKNKMGLL